MNPHAHHRFLCPLRGPCFAAPTPPFTSHREANHAVARYQACSSAAERRALAQETYHRLLPLARKTLHRFCHASYPESRCYPGACLPEDLIAETYPLFRQALDEYDSTRGVDFVGYLSRRLYWGLEHRMRWLLRARAETQTSEAEEETGPRNAEEDRLLQRLLVRDLLARLSQHDAELLTRYAAGHTSQELAESAGISPAALRKRLERIRKRLRALAGSE